jgi:Fe-S cluster biogenesis protein NfuA
MPAQAEFAQRLQSIERLIGDLETVADPNLRTKVRELLQVVMDLHGAALERMLELIHAGGDANSLIIRKFERDELVASLLVLYGLHPLGLEARVMQSLDKVRSRLQAHEADVQLVSIEEGAVRLKLQANGHGCGSTADSLKEMVENAVYQGAPDVLSLSIEVPPEKPIFVPLEILQKSAVLQKSVPGAL